MHSAQVFTEESAENVFAGNRMEVTTRSRYLILSVRPPFVIIMSEQHTTKLT